MRQSPEIGFERIWQILYTEICGSRYTKLRRAHRVRRGLSFTTKESHVGGSQRKDVLQGERIAVKKHGDK